MLRVLFEIRYVSVLAVVGSLFGALLMFLAGSRETIDAYRVFFGDKESSAVGGENIDATVKLLSSLDQFLFGLVLLYFAYSIYFLFLVRETANEEQVPISVPAWFRPSSLGEMKRTLLEVILVLLAVLFLKIGLSKENELAWELLVIPAGILAIAISLKLIHDSEH